MEGGAGRSVSGVRFFGLTNKGDARRLMEADANY